MKIALVSPYDFAHPGGVPNHISSLEHYLTLMGHEVKVIAPASRAVTAFGDRFIPIGKPRPIPSSGSIIRISISLRLASTIKEVLNREKFDIIHLHEPFMPMLCSAVLRFSNTVTVGTFHAADGKPGYNWGRPISTWMIKFMATVSQAEIVLRAMSYSTGELWRSVVVSGGACAYLFAYPYLSGKVNYATTGLTLGLKGRRVFPEGLLLFSIPYNWIPVITQNLQKMEWVLPAYTDDSREQFLARRDRIFEELAREFQKP